MAQAINPSMDICMLSHGNWEQTNRAIESVIKFDCRLHIGLTVECDPPLKHDQVAYYSVPWSNHFADARNGLLDVITTKCAYILWIDSDDYIYSMPSIDYFRFQDPILKVKLDYFSGNTPCLRSICHRRDQNIRWQGSVHEFLEVPPTVDVGRVSTIPGLLVVHDGYDDPAQLDDKHRRNLKIATRGLDSGSPDLGEMLALARHNMHFGLSSAIQWLAVYRTADKMMLNHSWLSDFRAEAAGALAYCGYFPLALAMLKTNPLNIPLQLCVLIAEHVYGGHYSKERMQFVAHCLQHGYADSNYSFPLALIGMDKDALHQYVIREGDDLIIVSKKNDATENQLNDMAVQYRSSHDVESESFEGDLILLSSVSLNVVSLNETAAILWEALAWPCSAANLIDLMLEAFPARPIDDITREVKTLINRLANEGLITAV
jgi:hypothetical protein